MAPPAKPPSTPKAHRYRDPTPYHHSHPLWNASDRKEYKILQRKEIYNTSPILAILPKDVIPVDKHGKSRKMKSKLQGQMEIAAEIERKKERRRMKVRWLYRLRKSTRMQADRDPVKTKEGVDGSGEVVGKEERVLFPKKVQGGLRSKQRPRARTGGNIFTTGKVKDIPALAPRERRKARTKVTSRNR